MRVQVLVVRCSENTFVGKEMILMMNLSVMKQAVLVNAKYVFPEGRAKLYVKSSELK